VEGAERKKTALTARFGIRTKGIARGGSDRWDSREERRRTELYEALYFEFLSRGVSATAISPFYNKRRRGKVGCLGVSPHSILRKESNRNGNIWGRTALSPISSTSVQ